MNGSCLAEELVFGILLVVLQSPTFEGVKIWLKTPLKPRGRYCKQGRAVPPSRHDDTYLQLLNPNREDHGASRLDGFVVQISRSDKARVEESQHLDLTRPSLLQQEERTTPWLWDSVLLYCKLTITTTNINASTIPSTMLVHRRQLLHAKAPWFSAGLCPVDRHKSALGCRSLLSLRSVEDMS